MRRAQSSKTAKALAGTLRPDRLVGTKVDSLAKLPAAPRALSNDAKDAWARFGKQAIALGSLSEFDLGLLELLSRTWASTLELERQLANDGLIVVSDSGARKAHPALQALDRARALAHRMLGDLGLSPPGRERISIRPNRKGPWDDNPFNNF